MNHKLRTDLGRPEKNERNCSSYNTVCNGAWIQIGAPKHLVSFGSLVWLETQFVFSFSWVIISARDDTITAAKKIYTSHREQKPYWNLLTVW